MYIEGCMITKIIIETPIKLFNWRKPDTTIHLHTWMDSCIVFPFYFNCKTPSRNTNKVEELEFSHVQRHQITEREKDTRRNFAESFFFCWVEELVLIKNAFGTTGGFFFLSLVRIGPTFHARPSKVDCKFAKIWRQARRQLQIFDDLVTQKQKQIQILFS